MLKKIIGIALLALNAMPLVAQDDMSRYAETISQADLKAHLSIIASDAYEGRETGQKGQRMAAEYITKYFKDYGLSAPVNGTYAQPFKLSSKQWKTLHVAGAKGKKESLKDYYANCSFNIEKGNYEAVFVGFGIDTKDYSDYKNIDVKGKVVFFLEGDPKDKKGALLFPNADKKAISTPARAIAAEKKGAKAVFVIAADDKALMKNLNLYKGYFSAAQIGFPKPDATFGRYYSLQTTAADLLGMKMKKLQKIAIAAVQTPDKAPETVKATIELHAEREVTPLESENILGFMEGTDKKDEILVITAHYDHIGIVDGQINNGADDDGSGTVTVLELAQAFAKAKAEGKTPRRSILFMTVSGEEKGLLGSEYYTENPIYPLAKTVTNLNIDMVGRVDKKHETNPNYVYVIGSDKLSSDLHKLSEGVAKKYFPNIELDYTYNDENDPNRFYYRSDHYNFAKNNIPIIFYFNGVHDDYHKPTDDVEKINFEKMEKIGRLVFATAWEIANSENKPQVDKKVNN